MASRKYPPIRDRFLSKTKQLENGCWSWSGSFFSSGYAQFWQGKKARKASRVSWELFRGEIPVGLYVLHRCDNKECVNPDHLHLGDHSQNMREASERGRHHSGPRHYAFRRTEELTNKVRELRRSGWLIKNIRAHLGIGHGTYWRCMGYGS